jgi:hypothetical protein
MTKISPGKAGETFDTDHRYMSPWLRASPAVLLGDSTAVVVGASPMPTTAREVGR